MRTVVSDCAQKKSTNLGDILWALHLENCINLLLPRFDTVGGQPMAKKVGFLDSPFALQRFGPETSVLETLDNSFDSLHVLFVGVGEDPNIVHVTLDVQTFKGLGDVVLSNIWSRLQSHCQVVVLVFAIWRDNGTEIFALII